MELDALNYPDIGNNLEKGRNIDLRSYLFANGERESPWARGGLK